MSSNKFNKTSVEAQSEVSRRIEKESDKLKKSESYKSANYILISMDKLVDCISQQQLGEIKEHIDNVYYHAGVVKGCNQ